MTNLHESDCENIRTPCIVMVCHVNLHKKNTENMLKQQQNKVATLNDFLVDETEQKT